VKTINTADATPAQLNWLTERAMHPECDVSLTHIWRSVDGCGEDDFLISDYVGDYKLALELAEHASISVLRCDDDHLFDAEGFTTEERVPVWGAAQGRRTPIASTESQPHANMFQVYEEDVSYGNTPALAIVRCYVKRMHGRTAQILEGL
jgi:hypothetical protein